VNNEKANPVKSLDKVLSVLECFSRNERDLGLADIAKRTELPRATTHRLLAALKSIGFIEQAHEGERYRLGMKLFEFGSVVLANMELQREAQPFISKLANLTGADVHLCIFDGAQAVLVDQKSLDVATRNTRTLLEGAPIHCTGVGKAMLAWLPDRVVDRIILSGLTVFTANTISDPDILRQELALIRGRGWALDDSEHQADLRCVAAPIFGDTGRIIAAISASGPANLVSPDRDDTNATLVAGIASQLSRRLGYT